ncbi:MAG: AAC(3) family N-acetyltransferase [Verrucomicrobia bacterium]|nr:AAC(3) family N-acetyltransferase [Verrucomicrobiota bacterium]MBU1734219.1 AAC(3) family N-acetyltransferase [Verrucomicrobiota bacterium]MBU1855757.1 AAC(3) family N-acetyltransferase [Verrucomicrobiota bacterium]
MDTIIRAIIVRDLQNLGLASGDTVLVHSSLSALGQVESGAETVIDALLDVIGINGTLLMPSFQKGGEHDLVSHGCVFDLRTSVSEMGLITETYRRRPGVLRSLSPTHCTAGFGPRAADLLKDHQACDVSVGKNSPYDKLVRADGRILLLGVTHSNNTTLHLVENINGAPTVCCALFKPTVVDTEGRSWIVPTYPHMPGLRRQYTRVEPELLALGIQVNGRVGQAESRLIKAHPMAETIGRRIRENPLYLCSVFTP